MQCWWEGEKAFFIGKVLPWFSEPHFPFLKLWNKKISKTSIKKETEEWREKIEKVYISNHLFFKYSALRKITEVFVECLTLLESVMSKVVTE